MLIDVPLHDPAMTPSDALAPAIIWSAWVGPLPLPGYLAAAWRTVVANNARGAQLRLVRDTDIPMLLPGMLHPSYAHLSYVHRADYVRMELLHTHGGLWLDLETIAMRNFSHVFRTCADDGHTVPSNRAQPAAS